MKYFLDTEFHEYKKQPTVCGIKVGKPIDTIELISIGIVSEGVGCASREYYAICKDFDLKAAWSNEWLRENVLISIHKDLCSRVGTYGRNYHGGLFEDFTYKSMKNLLNWYGKTKEQIAEEIKAFTLQSFVGLKVDDGYEVTEPEFYAYYADYDWVVFCWLFGRMLDLPKGFPMYCFDLKQELDGKISKGITENNEHIARGIGDNPYLYKLEDRDNYPKQTNEHNALADAKWNKELYKFLMNI